MEMIAKLQVNMSFVEAIDQISVYAKFMIELMKTKQILRDDENDELTDENVYLRTWVNTYPWMGFGPYRHSWF